ncbi:Gfo/Idh/MocA family oxidoreductase [Chloroflexia bacterium SDU3-3]|nr:Gfo/Idh/MocA family oxidoreductase [Chloroflexia bacterium SDU3-3]
MAEIGVGLIGYGGIGRVHALCYRMIPLCYPALALQPRIAAVQVATPGSAERVGRELPEVRATTSLADLLADPQVSLIDCCAPTADHAAIVRAALDAGKPVFCEKPLAVEPREAAALAALAVERGLVCGVNYHFRNIPALQHARRWIEQGSLGDPVGFHLRYYRASNLKRDRAVTWRFQGAGSGVLLDLGSHLVDLITFLLGPAHTVSAQTRTLIGQRPTAGGGTAQITSDDAAWLSLELTNGAIGTAHASKVAAGTADDLRVEAYGTRGTLIFDAAHPNELQIADDQGRRIISTLSASAPTPTYPTAEVPTATLLWHLSTVAGYLQSLGGQPGPLASFGQAAYVDAVLEAAQRSAASGVAHAIPADVRELLV